MTKILMDYLSTLIKKINLQSNVTHLAPCLHWKKPLDGKDLHSRFKIEMIIKQAHLVDRSSRAGGVKEFQNLNLKITNSERIAHLSHSASVCYLYKPVVWPGEIRAGSLNIPS